MSSTMVWKTKHKLNVYPRSRWHVLNRVYCTLLFSKSIYFFQPSRKMLFQKKKRLLVSTKATFVAHPETHNNPVMLSWGSYTGNDSKNAVVSWIFWIFSLKRFVHRQLLWVKISLPALCQNNFLPIIFQKQT